MKYLSIKEEGLSEYREKGSKFLGFAASAVSEEDVKKFLARINEAHPKARHLCYAYRLDLEKKIYRANDDGEPSGTAGKPILGQIDSKGLSKVIVGVIRYFGGTKLGTAGLFNAYKVSASDAIDNAVVAEFEVRSYFY